MRRVALTALAAAASPFILAVVLRIVVSPACACGDPPGPGARVLGLLGGVPDLALLGAVLALVAGTVMAVRRR